MLPFVATVPFFPPEARIHAKDVSGRIRELLKETGAPERAVAQGLALGETYFSRMKNRRTGFYRRESLHPLERLALVLAHAKTALSEKGIRKWLLEPNLSLNNVSPILCLRSDEEMEKVVSLLGAIGHGLPS